MLNGYDKTLVKENNKKFNIRKGEWNDIKCWAFFFFPKDLSLWLQLFSNYGPSDGSIDYVIVDLFFHFFDHHVGSIMTNGRYVGLLEWPLFLYVPVCFRAHNNCPIVVGPQKFLAHRPQKNWSLLWVQETNIKWPKWWRTPPQRFSKKELLYWKNKLFISILYMPVTTSFLFNKGSPIR